MSPVQKAVASAVVGGWAVFLFCGNCFGQASSSSLPNTGTLRQQWEQRVVRQEEPANTPKVTASRRTAQGWSPVRRGSPQAPVAATSHVVESKEVVPSVAFAEAEPELNKPEPIPPGEEIGPLSMGDAYYEPYEPGAVIEGDAACEACSPTGEQCYDFGPACGWPRCGGLVGRALQHCSFFFGAHGFKGPADLGRNGNFGLHAGLNWGGALGGPYGIGYQIGAQAVSSDFSGDQTAYEVRRADRDQVFLTAGLFRRNMCRGLQGGVVFDLMHDRYYGEADFKQIRGELSLVLDPCREIGFWGAFGTSDDRYVFSGQYIAGELEMEPTDLYTLFYRRQFASGGQGRIWTGFSGKGDAVLGADFALPLGRGWALENAFTYLVPKQGRGAGAQQEESWNVAMRLVWYPGRDAFCVMKDPFRPLFSVADNSTFLLDPR